MIAIAAYHLHVGPTAKGCTGQVRGIEKAKGRKQFDGEYSARQPVCNRVVQRSEGGRPCQYGTDEYASFWNGPRLRPAFAAQVLGQALRTPPAQNSSAYAAYCGRAVRIARFFDENL